MWPVAVPVCCQCPAGMRISGHHATACTTCSIGSFPCNRPISSCSLRNSGSRAVVTAAGELEIGPDGWSAYPLAPASTPHPLPRRGLWHTPPHYQALAVHGQPSQMIYHASPPMSSLRCPMLLRAVCHVSPCPADCTRGLSTGSAAISAAVAARQRECSCLSSSHHLSSQNDWAPGGAQCPSGAMCQ